MQVTDAGRFTLTLDQDPSVPPLVAEALGLESRWVPSLDALTLDPDAEPLAIFLDASMGVNGAKEGGSLIPRLKDVWPLSPLILTTGSPRCEELTEAMALGADDFVVKPFEKGDLAHRYNVRKAALARRAARETIVVGDMTIDTLQRSVATLRGQRFLSPTEVRLVAELAKARGAVVSREVLKTRCWIAGDVSDNALNRKLYEIRRRIKPLTDAIKIRTIYGVGFILEER
jgi:DNA-binding response OmpR family regulator